MAASRGTPAARDPETAVTLQHTALTAREARQLGEVRVCCPDCGQPQLVRPADGGVKWVCIRCERTLHHVGREVPAAVLAGSALVAIGLLGLGAVLPLMTAESGGRFTEASLVTGPELLLESGHWELCVALIVTLVIAPVVQLILLLLDAPRYRAGATEWRAKLQAWLPLVGRWSMLEVFLVSAIVAGTRLSEWLTVGAGLGLTALVGAVVATRVASRFKAPSSAGEPLGFRAPELRCKPRADSEHRSIAISRCGALTVAGFLLYLPANLLPIMTARKLTEGGPTTILGGVRELFRDGSWVLAVIVFLASVAVPLLKLCVLSVLLIMTARGSPRALRERTRAYRLIAIVGRWSMLDIFVLSVLVSLVRLGILGYVAPEPGAVAFCAVVVVTMIATEIFEPKLMWDAAVRRDLTLQAREASS